MSPFASRAITAAVLSTLALSGIAAPAMAAPPQRPDIPMAETTDNARYLVRYAEGADVSSQTNVLQARGMGVQKKFFHAVNAAVVTATPAQAQAMAASPQVEAVELDTPVHASVTQKSAPWGLDRTDQAALPLSGTYTSPSAGSGVDAYVVDTGVLSSHKDFSGRVTAGWSAIADGRGSGDCNGHGTHVAGTIAGSTFGMAKSASIIPVRVLDCNGSGYMSDVIAGLDWVAAQHTPGTPAVVNLSLGGSSSSTLDAALQGVIDDGVTATVAAGNSGTDACLDSPARVPAALTVAASDASDRQASFSNYGTCVDLYAPGVAITSAVHTANTATGTMSGTSMASPHVAGAAAILLSQKPALTPAETAAALNGNAAVGLVSPTGSGTPNRLLQLPTATVNAAAPTFHNSSYTIPSSTGARYQVDGTAISAGTYDADTMITVKAVPEAGYTLTGTTTWSHDFTPAFPDIADSNFRSEIRWMKEQGITTGYADGTFRPHASVTRSAMAAFLYRLAGSPDYTAPAVSPFSDVATDGQFYKEIAWMKDSGLSTGYRDGTYRSGADVNRQEMAAFIQRFAGDHCAIPAVQNYSAPNQPVFTDVPVNAQFFREIAWMEQSGISNGYADGTYRSGRDVSRQEMAAFMYRLDAFISNSGGCKA